MFSSKVYGSREIAEELGLEVRSVSKNARVWNIGTKFAGNYMFSEEERKIFINRHRGPYDKRGNRQTGQRVED